MKFAVIGAGFFGLSIAIKIKEKFKSSKVHIFEKENDILLGASGKNQFRCHMGYHYPRSENTIKECKDSFFEFNKYFSNTYLKSNNYYAIAKKNSLTNFEKYLKILKKNKLKFEIVDHALLKKDNIEGLIKADEKLINIQKVKKKFNKYIKKNKIEIFFKKNVNPYEDYLKNYDYIFLCTYDNNNNNLKGSTDHKRKFHYQLVEKVIVKSPKQYNNNSFVVLDGPFMCIDPYISNNTSILGSVQTSVIAKKQSIYCNFDKYFRSINSQYTRNIPYLKFPKIKQNFGKFFNGFDKVKYLKSFIVVRCTVKNEKDERVTVISTKKNVLKVFSGKWVNCMLTAEKLINEL